MRKTSPRSKQIINVPTRRRSVRTGIVVPIGVMATTVASLALVVPAHAEADAAAQACVPSPGTAAVFGQWVSTDKTPLQADPNPPADPDGSSDQADLTNVTQYVDRETHTKPGAPEVESSGWVREMPAGDGWKLKDTRTYDTGETVEVKPAVDQWWHWNPGQAGGVQDPTEPPPAAGWGKDNGNHTGNPAPPNEIYNVSKNENGNSSWFYHELRDAVTEPKMGTEYLYEREVATEVVEYSWVVQTRENTPGTPAVTCPAEPTDPTQPPAPVEPAEPTEPGGPIVSTPVEPAEPVIEGVESKPQKKADKPVVKAAASKPNATAKPRAQRHAEVPLTIDAGL